MTWLDDGPLFAIVVGYLLFLFGIAYAAERSRRLASPRLQMLTYVLAASIYCTAWTFYGSVGLAANRGVEFLTIYLGPALLALLWPILLRRLVRVAKEQRITSISDFISSRYGKSAPLGALVAALVVLGLIPYIALQLEAVSQSFKLIPRHASILDAFDPTLVVAIVLGVFGILFGARNPDFTRAQQGLLSAVAVESVVKLLAFMTAGAYVTWGLFGGFGDIFHRALADPQLSRLVTLGTPPSASFARWAALILISMMAVVFLPRQFHVLVVQNRDERHVAAASWMFPLYLFLINLFVLPIAFAGLLLLPREQADHFVLLLPLASGNQALAILVFLGGFSAATAMIVVDSLALSKMLTNDIVVPILLRNRSRDLYRASLRSMRFSILLVVFLGYGWAVMARGGGFLLVEMGLLSFVAVTQCAPAILLGLVWPRGNRCGAFAGISAGFALWFYTLIVPALVKEGILSGSLVSDGPFGVGLLRPTAFLGLVGLDSVSHGLFWSLLVNLLAYGLVSLATRQDAEERLQAAAFTGRFPGDGAAPVGRTILSPREIERLVYHYVGGPEAAVIAGELLGGKTPEELTAPELLELRIRLEKRLAASLGAAAARFIVEDRFTLSKGEAELLVESFQELQHSLRTTEEEVRRTERLLASVVRSVDDCIFTTDIQGRLVTVNPAGERLFGAVESELQGAPWWELLARGQAGAPDAIRRVASAWRAWKGEAQARTRTGRVFPAHLAITPIVDRRARVLGTVGVLRDLTEQHEMQRRLIHQEKLASLGQMAAGVAHEIRNPLGGIKMATGVLARHEGDTLSREMIDTMRSGIVEIESIVSHLLDYTRETRLDRQPYDVERIVRQVVQALAEEARGRGVAMSCSIVPSAMVALVDGQKIRQVLTNVARNAMEAAERRSGARVDVRAYGRDGTVVFEVSDNGTGLTPDARERMFLPFFTTKPTGTGLGLAIVKKIVDLHGGEVHVRSEPGQGTWVQILLPAGVLDEAASADRRR